MWLDKNAQLYSKRSEVKYQHISIFKVKIDK